MAPGPPNADTAASPAGSVKGAKLRRRLTTQSCAWQLLEVMYRCVPLRGLQDGGAVPCCLFGPTTKGKKLSATLINSAKQFLNSGAVARILLIPGSRRPRVRRRARVWGVRLLTMGNPCSV